jgi:hypothetical protein
MTFQSARAGRTSPVETTAAANSANPR